MARVTVEDCVDKVPNRFELVLLAAHRARAIASGSHLTVDPDNDKNPVNALREIAEPTVPADDLRESPALEIVRELAKDHPGPLAVVEPNVDALPAGLGHAELIRMEAAVKADIHLMLVDHTPFKTMAMPAGKIVDTRGVWRRS